ncbi:MAG: GNAT family N-acetyltransferase [Herminiimonas sp.]|nr:GNAT family N-acetyltransferase [Herminiimonas sp.]
MSPPLQLECFVDSDRYRLAVDGYLRADLGANNQLFTIVQGMTPESIRQRGSWLARLHRDGVTCGIAMLHSMPPLRSLILSGMDAEGAQQIARALALAGIEPSDVTGPRDCVAALVGAMHPAPLTRLRAELGNHVLDTLPVVPACRGSWRVAGTGDTALLTGWERGFMLECGFPVIEGQLQGVVEQRLGAPSTQYWIWEIDGVPAAMAVGRLLPPTARVGPVYTDPAYRGRGCAAALVAHLSRELIARGATAVSLFTDLANPVSNGVYRRLGYRMIGQLIHIDLERSPASATPSA